MKKLILVIGMNFFVFGAHAEDVFIRTKSLTTSYTAEALDCSGRVRQLLSIVSQEESRIKNLGGTVIEKEIADCTSVQDEPSRGINGTVYTAKAKIKYSIPLSAVVTDVNH